MPTHQTRPCAISRGAGTFADPRHTSGVPLVSRGAGTSGVPLVSRGAGTSGVPLVSRGAGTSGVPLVRSRLRLSTSGRRDSRLPRKIAEAPGLPGYRYYSWEADGALPCTGSIEGGSGPSGTVSLKPSTPAALCRH
ncbi:hypothetical protein [Sulfitobacter sediminilitoris]|uniref:hypothetical protein n=1 Tax=Sulfitobacter sediminilitoris TaxID=2698830 RepID=UPI00361555D5